MTGRHLAALPAAPFARHKGRHRRRLFHLNPSVPPPADDFTRVRTPALAPIPIPMAADELIPFGDYRRHPYDTNLERAS